MGYRKITVENKTYIVPLQMYGPIINAITVPDETVITLVKKGYTVNQKLKSGKFVRLGFHNMKNPEADSTGETAHTSADMCIFNPALKPNRAKLINSAINAAPRKIESPSPEIMAAPAPDVKDVGFDTVDLVDDPMMYFGEEIMGIDTTVDEKVEVPNATKTVVNATTPEERGLHVIEEKPTASGTDPAVIVFSSKANPILQAVNRYNALNDEIDSTEEDTTEEVEDSAEEISEEASEESTDDSQNQNRKKNKKKRRK